MYKKLKPFKTQKEVLQALLSGKKIKLLYEDDRGYLYLSKQGNICDQWDSCVDFVFTKPSAYEAIEEVKPKTILNFITKWRNYE